MAAKSQCLWSSASRFTNGSMEDGSIRCGGCGTWLRLLLIFISRPLQTLATSSRPSISCQCRRFCQARVRESETYVQQSATEGRLSLIQREQHVVKGLHVVCHGTVTPQWSEVPDCGLLMSSGLLNESYPAISDAPEQKLQAWLELGSKDCPLTVHFMELEELVPSGS